MWRITESVRETPRLSLNSMCAWWGQTPVWRPEVNLGVVSPVLFLCGAWG